MKQVLASNYSIFHTLYNMKISGTRLRYKPGTIIGGKGHVHECSLSRAIGYFLEPLLILCLFGKRPLSILLRGNVVSKCFSHTSLRKFSW